MVGRRCDGPFKDAPGGVEPDAVLTLNLDTDVHRALKSLARERSESLGAVVSELIGRALRTPLTATSSGPVSRISRFPVVDVPEDAPFITPGMEAEALEEIRPEPAALPR